MSSWWMNILHVGSLNRSARARQGKRASEEDNYLVIKSISSICSHQQGISSQLSNSFSSPNMGILLRSRLLSCSSMYYYFLWITDIIGEKKKAREKDDDEEKREKEKETNRKEERNPEKNLRISSDRRARKRQSSSSFLQLNRLAYESYLISYLNNISTMFSWWFIRLIGRSMR